MKFAYYINNNGEKIQISAYDKKLKEHFYEFICPYCGKVVDLIDAKKQERHFRHHHSTYSHECENYNQSISVSTYIHPYQREGLPLYLIEEFGTYSLKLGLYGLDESSIVEAENKKLKLDIYNNNNLIGSKIINLQNFSPEKMSFINIESINKQYKLRFSNDDIPTEIMKKYAVNVNGIGVNGAIFYSGYYGGKKVSSSIGVEVGEEYLLLTRNDISNLNSKGASFELFKEIKFGLFNNYKIYKFIITEINENTIKFAKSFDMELNYSKTKIVPIWPPCILLEQELVYEEGSSKKFFVLSTDNEVENGVYSHILKNKIITQEIKEKKYLFSSSVNNDEFLSISHLKNQFVFSLVKRNIERYKFIPNIHVEVSNQNIDINTNVKIFINQYKNDILMKSSCMKKDNFTEQKLIKNGKIEILHGVDSVYTMLIEPKLKETVEIDKVDKELLFKINLCKGPLIKIPDSFKWMVIKKKKYKYSYNELKKYIKKKKVPIELINLLKTY